MQEAIDSCKYLFLRGLDEPEDNVLRLVLEEAEPQGSPEDLEVAGVTFSGTQVIDHVPGLRVFKVVWPSYVAYSVRNESYTTWDEGEIWEGRLFRVYSASHFLSYVSSATFAGDVFPGPLQHWEVVCGNHIIDVVGAERPQFNLLDAAGTQGAQ